MIVILNINNQSINKIDNGYMKNREIYKNINKVYQKAGKRSQLKKKELDIESSNFSSLLLLLLSYKVFIAN